MGPGNRRGSDVPPMQVSSAERRGSTLMSSSRGSNSQQESPLDYTRTPVRASSVERNNEKGDATTPDQTRPEPSWDSVADAIQNHQLPNVDKAGSDDGAYDDDEDFGDDSDLELP